jgi:hypothetical protein
MTSVSLASLLIQETKAAIYSAGLSIASAVGLPVSSWQPGDPTRTLFYAQAEKLEKLDAIQAQSIRARFLDYAEGDWLTILADQQFGVVVPSATYASTEVVLTNNGGGVYGLAAGDLTFKSTLSGKTYRNTTGGTLAAKVGSTPGTLTITVVADEPGSDSSAGAGEIDALVTTLLGVTCSNPLAAIGVDKQSDATTRQQCRDRLGRLSPNGPREAYADVARDSSLTGTSGITRVRAYGDSTNGAVTVYLAGPSGAVSSADRTLVETAILKWATPLCITPFVLSCTNVVVPVTYQLWVYKSCNKTAGEVASDVQAALSQMLAARPIGGDIIAPSTTGILSQSLIESTIRSVYPQAFRVVVSSPASDVSLANGLVAALGTVTATVNIVEDP